jgi:hypothetical protein
VAGSDRIPEYSKLLSNYNGIHDKHGYYNFKSMNIHSSGDRDPDAEGVQGISASKMREFASTGNKKAFAAGAPSAMKPQHVNALYNDVRSGMTPPQKKGVKEYVRQSK